MADTVIELTNENVKYVEVEIKSPGFSVFTNVIAVNDDLTISGLADRFHNLHPDVENTIKRVGFMYPPIAWEYMHPKMDIVVEHGKSEWVRIRVIDRMREAA